MFVKEFVAFIKERERVRLAREAGKPRPWTKDPILDKYRFCNIRREDDYVTRWLRSNYYRHLAGDIDLWFAAVVARLFNQPDALYEIMPHILTWKPETVRRILHERKEAGKKNFNAAYIVSTNGVAMDKVDYLVYKVLGLMWAERKNMRPKPGDTLFVYYDMLTQFDGIGSFIAGQIVADLKYVPECPLHTASDWQTFAASGPGSRRGLNRVFNREVDAPWKEVDWHGTLMVLAEKPAVKALELHAQDLQNCLCEFDKYERARLGEGEPKQIYKERVDGAVSQ